MLLSQTSKIPFSVCVCIPILITTFPEWLSGTIAAHTRRRASVLIVFVVFSVLHAHVQFCRFDKADATADVQ